MNKSFLLFLISFINIQISFAQDLDYKAANTGNPLIPGYFADPTVLQVADTFYIFATTDGVRLASGEPQVWRSTDFVNWYDQEINLPFQLSNVWAPDVLKGTNGMYYYFHGNCENGCNIYGYTSASLLGSWKTLNDGKPLITPAMMQNLPALDQHYFMDDDGSLYVYFGTWISSFKGLGWMKIDPKDIVTVLDKGVIPNSELPDIFEAPYMVKRNGKYFMMYSSGDCQASTYRVQYAYSNSPTGPFERGANNPILETSANGKIDGPGHHSVLKKGNGYYIVYHRHDNPHSGGGEYRQLCADTLIFLNDSIIKKVVPTNKGVGFLAANQITAKDYALGAKATASSTYHLVNVKDDYTYEPGFVTDNNNGTMWRAGSTDLPQSLTIDLGKDINIKRVMTQFEYATFYYQYKLEYSIDNTSWTIFADKTQNRESGSPLIDVGNVTARYLKLTVTGTEKTATFAAVWNIKVYDQLFSTIPLQREISNDGPGVASTKSLLVELSAKNLPLGDIVTPLTNQGTLGGEFSKKNNPKVVTKYNVKAIGFDGNSYLKLSKKAPLSLSWNSSFTVSAWVLNPNLGEGECLAVWSSRDGNLMGEYAALMYGFSSGYGAAAHWGRLDMPYGSLPEKGKWHHIALTFDGMVEKVYVDGTLNNQSQKNLYVHPNCDIIIGSSGTGENFSGFMASLRIYDKCLSSDSIQYLLNMDLIIIDYNATGIKSIEKKNQNKPGIFYNKSIDKVILENQGNLNPIERVDIIDLNGRLVNSNTKNVKNNYFEIETPDTQVFIIHIVGKRGVYSRLIVKN